MPKANVYQCEMWTSKGWATVPAQYARAYERPLLRCIECHGAVRIHQEGDGGTPRAHPEHLQGHPGCSLGHYFRGVRSKHPNPVLAPDEIGQSIQGRIAVGDDESAFPEGTIKYGWHRRLERDSSLVTRLKAKRFAHTGKLECEVCSFDFAENYGEIGLGFIEAHHTVPVSSLSGADSTKSRDLALVCSNCHRMLHRCWPPLTLSELKKLAQRKCEWISPSVQSSS